MGDRVAIFATGGRLAQYGTPAVLAHPADDFVADFVGSTKGLRRLTVTDRPRPPRAARRDRHRRPRRRHRHRRHLRGGPGALLRDDKQVVGVRRGPQFVGVLTPNGIHRALRASLKQR